MARGVVRNVVQSTFIDTFASVTKVGAVPSLSADGVNYEYSGATVDTDGVWTFDTNIEIPAATIKIGETTDLSACTGALIVADQVNSKLKYIIESEFDSTGADEPTYLDLGAEFALDIQIDFSQTLTANPLTYSLTGTVTLPSVRQINTMTFKTGAILTNVRARFLDNATGIVMRHIPSKADWDAGTGVTTVAGDNLFNFLSTAADTPGVFNLGVNPFLIKNGQQVDIEIAADSINILGNISGVPYQVAEVQDGPYVPLSEKDTANRNQTTGLLEGGVITQASPTTVDWTSGRGIVVIYSDPEHVDPENVTWDAVSGYTPTNIATDGVTIFGYDKNGVLVEILATDIVLGNAKEYIFFGSVNHFGGVIISILTAPGNMAYRSGEAFNDFFNLIIGPANVSGNIYGANGANLNIDVVGGAVFAIGSNFRNDPNLSDIATLPSASALTFSKVYRLADPSESMTFDGVPTTVIDPSKYDDGSGTLQTVTTYYWTIQRIFRTRSGDTFVAYGQQEFATQALALDALGSEPFEEKSPLGFTFFRSSLVVQEGATDLSNTAQAEFFEQSSFRVFGAQSAASTIPGITVPGGNDTNIQLNDGGTFGGSNNFTYTVPSNFATVTMQSLGVTGGSVLKFNNSSSLERLSVIYQEGSNASLIEAVSNDLTITSASNLTFEYGLSSLVLTDSAGNNSVNIVSSATDKDVNFNIKDSLGQTVFKVEHNDVSGQTSLDIINDAGSTKFATTFNQTLDDVFISTSNGCDLYVTSADLLFIRSNDNIEIEAIGSHNIVTRNDEANFTINNTAGNYVFDFTNTLDNTVPLMRLSKTGTNGGASQIFTSTVAPESVITGSGGDLCVVDDGISSELYIKLSDGGNTGWESFLHGSSGVQGPGSTTDNAIATWDGTDGLLLQNSNVFVSSNVNSTFLAMNTVTSSGQSVLELRNNASLNQFTINYNQLASTVNIASATGVDTLFSSGGTLELRSSDNMQIQTTGDYTLTINNDEADFIVQPLANNYKFTFTNSLDHTVPLIQFLKTTGSGGTSEWYFSTISPEGVITANGGDICIRDAGTSSDIYLKRTDGGNTGWIDLLHAANGVKGPATSTNNGIAIWNSTDGSSIASPPELKWRSVLDSRDVEIESPSSTGIPGLNINDSGGSTQIRLSYAEVIDTAQIDMDAAINSIIFPTGGVQFRINVVTELFEFLGQAHTDEDELITYTTNGTNGAASSMFLGDRDPVTNVTGTPGNEYKRVDGIGSRSYVHIGSTSNADDWGKVAIIDDTAPFGGFGLYENIITWSEDLTETEWEDPSGNTTVTANNATAPNGEQTADRVAWTTTGLGLRQNITLISTETYTLSFFAEHVSGNNTLTFDVGQGTSVDVTVDTSIFRRYTIQLIAGATDNYLNIYCNTTTGTFNLWGFNIHKGTDEQPYSKAAERQTDDGYGISISGNIKTNNFLSYDNGTRIAPNTSTSIAQYTLDTYIGTTQSYLRYDNNSNETLLLTLSGDLIVQNNGLAGDINVISKNNIGLITSSATGKIAIEVASPDTNAPLSISTTGTNGGTSQIFLTSRTPTGNITGNGGDIVIRDDGISSEMYVGKTDGLWSRITLDSDTNAFGGSGRLQNRLRWTEDFSNTVWVKVGGIVTVTSDAVTAPNGELADTLQWTSSGLGLRQSGMGTVNGNTYTVSFWAKHITGTNQNLTVDINDGGASTVRIDSNDWQRYSRTLTAGGSGPWLDFTHGSTSTFAIWGVQVNDGIEEFPYLKREDIAKQETTDYGLSVDGKIIFSGSSVDSDDIITNLTTGVLEGGTLSINGVDDSLIDVTAGKALIADYSTPGSPNIRQITWDAQTVDPTLGTPDFIKWIGVQESSTPGIGEFVFDVEFTQEEKRTIAIAGRAWGDGVTDSIIAVGQYTTSATGQAYIGSDLSYILGSINKRGNVYSPNGANLTLNKSDGVSYRYTADYSTKPTAPNVHTDAAQTAISSYWYLLQGGQAADIQTDIDPDNYDLAGVKTAVPAGKYTLQRLYYYPVSQVLAVPYGQEVFDSMVEAIGTAGEDIVTIPEQLLEGGILRGWIAIKQGATDLSDPTQALFKESRSVGEPAAKGAVGTTSFSKSYAMGDYGTDDSNFVAGFYEFSTVDTTLTIGGTVTEVFGDLNRAGGYHAYCVASGPGVGIGLILTVSGTSIADDGTRTTSDSEILVLNVGGASANQYFETSKRWLGQVTYTLTGTSGSFTFNYGVAKYDTFRNRNFTVTDFEGDGKAQGSASNTDIILWAHTSTGWVYSAAAFTGRPSTKIVDMATDYATDSDIDAGGYFDYTRTNIGYSVNGSAGEGIVIEFVQTTNAALYYANFHVDVLV
jgi:hypothetical protein